MNPQGQGRRCRDRLEDEEVYLPGIKLSIGLLLIRRRFADEDASRSRESLTCPNLSLSSYTTLVQNILTVHPARTSTLRRYATDLLKRSTGKRLRSIADIAGKMLAASDRGI